MTFRRYPLLVALCALALRDARPLLAQAVPPNSPPKRLLTGADALLLGGFAVGTVLVAPLDKSFAVRLQNPRAQENRFFRRSAQVVRSIAAPGAFIIGGTLYTVGRLGGNERMADLGLHGTEALAIGSTVGALLKGTFGRARPYVHPEPDPRDYQLLRGFRTRKSTDYQSFPSGHTIAGFAAAAAVTSETRRLQSNLTWVVGPILYGGATLAGLSRMYNNRHWASDVMTGAAIGTFAGLKVVRYHHSHPDNAVDKLLLNFSVSPTETGEWRRVGLSVVPLR